MNSTTPQNPMTGTTPTHCIYRLFKKMGGRKFEGTLRRALMLVGLCAAPLLLSGCFFYTTGPNEIGVKVIKFSLFGKSGVDTEIYAPGMTHFYMPVITEFHTFDTKLQNLEMTFDKTRGDQRSRDDLLFKTIDGNDISLDVIITYRVIPEKAPHILQYVATNDTQLRQEIVRTVARSRPRDIFGELKTEEFYVSKNRDDKAHAARDALNIILEPYGVTVERISTKDYRFNEAYQKAIEDKKVADQQAEKNKAGANAAEQEWLKKLQDAQAEVNRTVAEADGRLRQTTIEADAYFGKQKQIAEAIKVEGRNEAKGIAKMNQALAGAGGNVMVKLQIAEALMGKKIMLLPSGGYNIKNLDMNRLIELYGVKKMQQGAAKPTPNAAVKAPPAEVKK